MRWCPIVRRSYLSALIGILRDETDTPGCARAIESPSCVSR